MSLPNSPFLRTPPERFTNLPDFPYEPRYLQYGNLRMAYIDERTGSGPKPEVFLCLHGQPTWSYLYRKMIPIFLNYTTLSNAQAPSRRVIAPDLFGFGRSDKPTLDADFTFDFHRASLLHLVQSLNLTNITLVVQDWGGLLGLTLPIEFPERFKRLIVMNTSLGTGTKPTKGFLDWLAYNNRTPDMAIGALLKRSCKHLSVGEIAAYDAPFPSQAYKAGVRRFPNLVPIRDDMQGVEISRKSKDSYRTGNRFGAEDVFVAVGMQDPVLGPPVMQALAVMFGNGCSYLEVEDAGHFVQEWGEGIARKAVEIFEKGDRAGIENLTKVGRWGRSSL